MARTMTIDNTEVYRALVTYVSSYNGKVAQAAYGPYDSRAHARDHDARWRKGPTRVEKQVLRVVGYEGELEWGTLETKYTNGGEDVEWDD